MGSSRAVLHVEACLKQDCYLQYEEIRTMLDAYLRGMYPNPIFNTVIPIGIFNNCGPSKLRNALESLRFCELRGGYDEGDESDDDRLAVDSDESFDEDVEMESILNSTQATTDSLGRRTTLTPRNNKEEEHTAEDEYGSDIECLVSDTKANNKENLKTPSRSSNKKQPHNKPMYSSNSKTTTTRPRRLSSGKRTLRDQLAPSDSVSLSSESTVSPSKPDSKQTKSTKRPLTKLKDDNEDEDEQELIHVSNPNYQTPLYTIPMKQIDLEIHVFHVSDDLGMFEMAHNTNLDSDIPDVPMSQFGATQQSGMLDRRDGYMGTQGMGDPMGNGSAESQVAHHLLLPSRSLFGLWETLVFEDDLTTKLLDYVYSAMLFGDRGVDSNIISLNRVVLLHGPPGTGKTTLCRSLAQKIAIRLQHRYSHGRLIEINSHSLFSKFFSESGKLVTKLFDGINQILDAEQDVFVCVLIDEVESLSAARRAALNGMEPSDSVRVVNALLTQLDKLKQKPNVLILTTSNLTDAIDVAFIDRADVKQYVGEPTPRAKYAILSSCIKELQDKNLIKGNIDLIHWRELDILNDQQEQQRKRNQRNSKRLKSESSSSGSTSSSTISTTGDLNTELLSQKLYKISEKCAGLSGRTLRKLPFLAFAYGIRKENCTMNEFLKALNSQITIEKRNKTAMTKLSD